MLQWEPLQPYTFITQLDKKLLFEKAKRSGIYIWGFMDDENLFWPYYVGKHRNIPYRLCDHLALLSGGGYTVYSNETLFGEKDIPIYEPVNLTDRINLLTGQLKEVEEGIKNMKQRFWFTYALLSEYKLMGDDCERVTIHSLNRKILHNKRAGKVKIIYEGGNLFEIIDKRWKEVNTNIQFPSNKV